jgi:capsular polysaccharide biosynthesis protein
MSNQPRRPVVNFSNKLYRRLLCLYPAKHRQEYGTLMAQLFRDQCDEAYRDDAGIGLMKLWCRISLDIAKTTVTEHLSEIQRNKNMLNKPLFTSNKPRPTRGWPLAAAIFLLIVLATTTITFMLPEAYRSTARIEVTDKTLETAEAVEAKRKHTDDYSRFIETETEKIKSKKVLYPVIEDLQLNRSWGQRFGQGPLKTQETFQLVLRQIRVRQTRNTSLIEISVSGPDPNEASMIANQIAKEYANVRQKSIAVQVVDEAEPTKRAISPNIPLNLALGILVGLVAASLALLIRRPPKTPEPIHEMSEAPLA